MNKETRKKLISKYISLKGHTNVKELAGWLSVSERTIERDISSLISEYFPIYTRPGRYHGGIFLLNDQKIHSLFERELGLLKKIETAVEKGIISILSNDEINNLKTLINIMTNS